MKDESKKEARNRRRNELLINNGLRIGNRKPRSAKAQQPVEKLKCGICLVCKNPSYKCACYGQMSQAAFDRFYKG